jgi:hypothetical protein
VCHPGQAFPAAIGEVCNDRDWLTACTVTLSARSKACNRPACPQAAIVVIDLRNAAGRGQTEPMRVVVTLIGRDGTMRRQMADTAAASDTGPWEELLARALAALPPYRAVPGGTVYHLRVDDQVVLVAEHDVYGPLYDLIAAVLAIGEAPY